MRPFNLEEAKAGAKVCTRDGRPVRIICFDRKGMNNACIVALVSDYDGKNEFISAHLENGKCDRHGNTEWHLLGVLKV